MSQNSDDLTVLLDEGTRITDWEFSLFSMHRKTIFSFLRVQSMFRVLVQDNFDTRVAFYLPSNALSFLSTHPLIHFCFVYTVLCVAKQIKHTTLGHCYTPGDQAATWPKIANEGGATKRQRKVLLTGKF